MLHQADIDMLNAVRGHDAFRRAQAQKRADRIARKSARKQAAVVAEAHRASREAEYRAQHGDHGPLPWRCRVLPGDPWADVRKRS